MNFLIWKKPMSDKTNQELNVHAATVKGFGDEWSRFDQSKLPESELKQIFNKYFSLFPWDILPTNAKGIDMGCGSGRWAKLVAPKVGRLHCVDPSIALDVARKNLSEFKNCEFHNSTADAIPVEDGSLDFGYSLGVLHHIPDTQAGIKACVEKLKPGAPLLIYLYYNFENRSWWFQALWRGSDLFRIIISRFPYNLRYISSQVIAILIYFPLARFSRILEIIGFNVSEFPLSAYRSCSFYTMRTDSLDRFGTTLEQRFSRDEIKNMMVKAGLERIKFSSTEPFWCAIGYRCSQAND
jgi:ubiquinone/menaquinone biosynthesis C-methylase UbiE